MTIVSQFFCFLFLAWNLQNSFIVMDLQWPRYDTDASWSSWTFVRRSEENIVLQKTILLCKIIFYLIPHHFMKNVPITCIRNFHTTLVIYKSLSRTIICISMTVKPHTWHLKNSLNSHTQTLNKNGIHNSRYCITDVESILRYC